MFNLEGKVALITGAGQNIGAGIARLMARQGATVIVNDYHADRAERTAADIAEAGGTARALPFDVTDLTAVKAAVASIEAGEGRIDILVNNVGNAGVAGTMGQKPFADLDPSTWSGPIDVNLTGMFNCCHAVLPGMIARKAGRIITNTSGAGQTGLDIGVSIYGAAKSGQIGFMRHLAVETGVHGITCNTIAIGLVIEKPVGVRHLADAIPLGRLGKPEDVGGMAVYLASDEAGWVTGQVIGVNGGSYMP